MLTNLYEPIYLSVLFVGVILSIVELGILVFIIKTHERKDRKYFIYIFILTILWAAYMVTHEIEYFDINLMVISHIIAVLTIIFFAFLMPKLLKFYNTYMLVIAGISAVMALVVDFLGDYYLPSLKLFYTIAVILPPVLGYFMLMEAAIRKR